MAADSGSSLLPLDTFLADRRTLTREQFLKIYSCPVLVLTLSPDGGVLEDEGAFRTQSVTLSAPQVVTPSAKLTAVVPILKRQKDPFPTFIWVGRESRCDVSLPFASISKLQAQFVQRPTGEWDLLDAGSTNGTFVDGEKLAKNKPYTLWDLSRVRFGKIDSRFRTPAGFYDELAQYL